MKAEKLRPRIVTPQERERLRKIDNAIDAVGRRREYSTLRAKSFAARLVEVFKAPGTVEL